VRLLRRGDRVRPRRTAPVRTTLTIAYLTLGLVAVALLLYLLYALLRPEKF